MVKYWPVIFVAITAATASFVCILLAPDVTVWPLIVLDGPALLLSARLPDTYYLVLTPTASGFLFSLYTYLLLITHGRIRALAAILTMLFHSLCAAWVALAAPFAPY
jgi:hypothetical protein